MFNQSAVTYKESRDDTPPPQRVREETATPYRVTRTQSPYHPPSFKREPIEDKEIFFTSPPLLQMEPHQTVEQKQNLCSPKPNSILQDDGDTPAKNTRAKRRTLTQEVMLSCM